LTCQDPILKIAESRPAGLRHGGARRTAKKRLHEKRRKEHEPAIIHIKRREFIRQAQAGYPVAELKDYLMIPAQI